MKPPSWQPHLCTIKVANGHTPAMKKSPLLSFLKSFTTPLAIVLCFAACQNASHIVAAEGALLTRPAGPSAQERPAPPSFSAEYSVSALYNEYQYQWGMFSSWLSSGMMQPHRTIFPR